MRKLPPTPFLYPIIDSTYSTDLLNDALEAVRAGVGIFQLRAKNLPKSQIYEIVKTLDPLCLHQGIRIVLNDYVDIALVSEVCGVHLGQDDFPVTEARRLLPDRIIGISTHTEQQFEEALALPVDYIAVGPIYPTSTKPDAAPSLGSSFLRKIRERTSLPLICIGGIRRDHIHELLAAGADGIALISELYKAPSIYDSTSALLEFMSNRNHE